MQGGQVLLGHGLVNWHGFGIPVPPFHPEELDYGRRPQYGGVQLGPGGQVRHKVAAQADAVGRNPRGIDVFLLAEPLDDGDAIVVMLDA